MWDWQACFFAVLSLVLESVVFLELGRKHPTKTCMRLSWHAYRERKDASLSYCKELLQAGNSTISLPYLSQIQHAYDHGRK